MRTRLHICQKKIRYKNREEAISALQAATIIVRPYKCDRCHQFHLTSRTKGKWMPKNGY